MKRLIFLTSVLLLTSGVFGQSSEYTKKELTNCDSCMKAIKKVEYVTQYYIKHDTILQNKLTEKMNGNYHDFCVAYYTTHYITEILDTSLMNDCLKSMHHTIKTLYNYNKNKNLKKLKEELYLKEFFGLIKQWVMYANFKD